MNMPMIQDVISNDMCIACGACIYACGEENIKNKYSDYRCAHEVLIIDDKKCNDCKKPCESVCPSIEVNYVEFMKNHFLSPEKELRIGPVGAVKTGYAKKHRDNGVSSSGGVVRALIVNALESGQKVICLYGEGKNYRPHLITELETVKKIPGSIYHSVSFTNCIHILKELDSPCLLVSTPCQLEGVEKYILNIEPELKNKIALKIGLICGWMFSDHGVQAFAKYNKINEPLVDMGYRGESQAGNLKLKTKSMLYSYDRRVFNTFNELLNYKACFSSPVNRLRCRICQNHTNVLADISVGDAWLKSNKGEKRSLIVIRTNAGSKVIEQMSNNGQLILEKGSVEDIVESQSANLVFGNTAMKLQQYLRNKNIFVPRFIFHRAQQYDLVLSRGENIIFRFEFVLRNLLRNGRYEKFKFMYFIRHMRKLLRQYTSAGIRRWLRKIS